MNTISSSSHKKRPREANKENHTTQASTSASISKKPRISTNVYKTLPPPITGLVELRFQLTETKGVWRVVHVPTNYTLANLHKLMQYMFGWSDEKGHKMYIYTHIEMYSYSYKPGCIKGFGGSPKYAVAPEGQLKSLFNFGAILLEDQELTLNQIWNPDANTNASDGTCGNSEIALIYEYNSNPACAVHVTHMDFYEVNIPTRSVLFVNARGAPHVEGVPEAAPDELEPANKSISDRMLLGETFELYCRGEVGSQVQEENLVIYDTEKGIKAAEDKRKARLELRALLVENAKLKQELAEQKRKEYEEAEMKKRARQERKERELLERRIERRLRKNLEQQQEAQMIAFTAGMAEEQEELSNEDAEALIVAVATGAMPAYAAILLLPRFASDD